MALAGRAAALLSVAIFAACSVVPSPVVPGKVIGPVGAPQVAEVLGRPVRAASAAEMQHLILLELTDRYAAEHGITASPEEVEAYIAEVRRVVPADRARGAAPADSAETRAAREQIARAFILQHKIDGALYRQYGGRIALMSSGVVPVDAYRRFLEGEVAAGRLRILDPAMAREFWRYYTDDSLHRFAPEGSAEALRALDLPALTP